GRYPVGILTHSDDRPDRDYPLRRTTKPHERTRNARVRLEEFVMFSVIWWIVTLHYKRDPRNNTNQHESNPKRLPTRRRFALRRTPKAAGAGPLPDCN
ncbi:MAG TPA: hypothetical protein VFR80_12810, partial [Pyrinomonadaceae bacterium]|nr:hypothetical protein [Pyrinomonadaceae bacterium]